MDYDQRAPDQTGWDSVGAALRTASACRKSPPAAAFSDRCLRNVCAQGPGKAGRYELTLEGRRALQTSRKGFVSDLGRPTGRLRLSKKPLCIVAKWLLVVGEGRKAGKVATCGGRVS